MANLISTKTQVLNIAKIPLWPNNWSVINLDNIAALDEGISGTTYMVLISGDKILVKGSVAYWVDRLGKTYTDFTV